MKKVFIVAQLSSLSESEKISDSDTEVKFAKSRLQLDTRKVQVLHKDTVIALCSTGLISRKSMRTASVTVQSLGGNSD